MQGFSFWLRGIFQSTPAVFSNAPKVDFIYGV
jgi:hypothetical protein